jgi:hypothetical protein
MVHSHRFACAERLVAAADGAAVGDEAAADVEALGGAVGVEDADADADAGDAAGGGVRAAPAGGVWAAEPLTEA